jgi:hypothetical protein
VGRGLTNSFQPCLGAFSTPAAATEIQLITRLSGIILRDDGFSFCNYILLFWRLYHLSKPFSGQPVFSIFQPFILFLSPDSPFCSDIVRNASEKLYPCAARVCTKSPFKAVMLSLHPMLQPDLFFELIMHRTEKKRNQSGFLARIM